MPIDVSSAEMQVIASTTEVKPFSFDAEQALLGGILINPSCFASVVRLLANENDFYYEQHRLVFSSMQSLSMRSIPHNSIGQNDLHCQYVNDVPCSEETQPRTFQGKHTETGNQIPAS